LSVEKNGLEVISESLLFGHSEKVLTLTTFLAVLPREVPQLIRHMLNFKEYFIFYAEPISCVTDSDVFASRLREKDTPFFAKFIKAAYTRKE
jgi:hypothetical protein